MELYLLRHAIAVTRETTRFQLLTSPYLRSRQTAELAAAGLGAETKVERMPHLAPDGNPRTLIGLIASRSRERGSILVVGHEPYLSQLISVLLAGDARIAITMKKAGLCKLMMQTPRYGKCATLEWLLTPAQAESIR